MNIHTLDHVEHKYFLALGCQDSLTKDPFKAGDVIVFCSKCKIPYLLSTWQEIGNKCPNSICEGHTQTLAGSFPEITTHSNWTQRQTTQASEQSASSRTIPPASVGNVKWKTTAIIAGIILLTMYLKWDDETSRSKQIKAESPVEVVKHPDSMREQSTAGLKNQTYRKEAAEREKKLEVERLAKVMREESRARIAKRRQRQRELDTPIRNEREVEKIERLGEKRKPGESIDEYAKYLFMRDLRTGRASANQLPKYRECYVFVDDKFFKRHPERKGRLIEKHEKQENREWLQIRNDINACSKYR
ncbi:MAG: hypothetical protein GY941_29300 [Planctomycetes bacterium]|nr:hypothetical protein [Planctomycetota bacterium]